MQLRRSLQQGLRHWARVFLCSFMMAGVALAGNTLPLYEESLIVADKTNPTRLASMRIALAHVLVRVSGNAKVMTQSAIEKLAQAPEQYLQAYEYHTQTTNDPKNSTQWKCRYVFDAKKINQLLSSHGQKVWAAQRPNVLLWWAVAHNPDGNDNELYKHDSQSTFLTQWKQQAALRGFTTTLPLNELAPQTNIEVLDITQSNLDKLKLASHRYRTDAQAVVTLKMNKDGGWQGSLQLLPANPPTPLKITDKDPSVVISGLVDQLVGQLAHKPSTKTTASAATSFMVSVNDVQDRKHFQKMSRYLSGLPSVKSVQVVTVSANQVRLLVRYQGDEKAFVERIERDNIVHLLNTANRDSQNNQHAAVQLQWIG